MKKDFARDGFVHLPWDARTQAWANAAYVAVKALPDAPHDMRHGGTWRVGVDALANAPDGSVDGVALRGLWEDLITSPDTWHAAQVSIVYAGYPKQDPDETEAAHRFRLMRDAAHVDGLLPEGQDRRRHLRKPHAFILGLPLNEADGSPMVVWVGSHVIVRNAFAKAFDGIAPDAWGDVDVTDIYQSARREVFDTCERVLLPAKPGEATLLHRHVVHGVAPWDDAPEIKEGRIIAYFRPEVAAMAEWL